MLRHARLIRVRGVVQGVGFRPFAYRLAQRYALAGWVNNGSDGVTIHVEGERDALDAFASALVAEAPAAATIAASSSAEALCEGFDRFEIRTSEMSGAPTARISPDLAVCDACLRELFDAADRRYRYPYITCTDCGPRYSIVLRLPYDRTRTTMAPWPLCAPCAAEYRDPADRRFHAQPLACPQCGPTYVFLRAGGDAEPARGDEALAAAVRALRTGAIVAIKGIGGYHLACDARDAAAVQRLRERKYRKERPLAVMARGLATARELVALDAGREAQLTSVARPIVLAPARVRLPGVAPENDELGVMLPYAPLHFLLFADGAPSVLVLTSANRSNEPIAYDDADAFVSLAGIADAFLVGERPIARRVDDAVVRVSAGVPVVLRRSRGFAPCVVATLPAARPMLALGGDLKNAPLLVVGGEAVAGPHVGDLAQHAAREAFGLAVRDLCATYELAVADALVVCDEHPEYVSTALAGDLSPHVVRVQHHRAHIASVLAERGELATEVLGFAFDGTGYGDDGTIWGGEVFAGSVGGGLLRVGHLRAARLPGGDAAARFPAQAAAGFLAELDGDGALAGGVIGLGERYRLARELLTRDLRCFATTSMGRLFDCVAALLGFVREATFEGQAAMWLEHLARADHAAWPAPSARGPDAYPFPYAADEFDYRPLLAAIVADRSAGEPPSRIARRFHAAVASAVVAAAASAPAWPVVCSGGVFQNGLLVEMLVARLGARLWLNRAVPPNDGGLALGQAALAAATLPVGEAQGRFRASAHETYGFQRLRCPVPTPAQCSAGIQPTRVC